MVLPEAPSSESCHAAPSCRHALVKTALSGWRGRRCSENATALFRVTLDGGLGPPPHFEVLTAKACDGKGKVW
jgi:hypothetical protein